MYEKMIAVTSHTAFEKWLAKEGADISFPKEALQEGQIGFPENTELLELYLEQIRRIARSDLQGVILREKDLEESKYEDLAKKVLEICKQHGKPCILHYYPEAARRLAAEGVHLPLEKFLLLKKEKPELLAGFKRVGVSTHSVEDAILAYSHGATYLTAGHVYATDCKKGLPPRGLAFLKEVCKAVPIPVYGIGGIHSGNVDAVLEAGAAAGCIMSAAMNPAAF